MNFLRTFWPLSFREKKEVKDLVITIVIYVVASVVVAILTGLLGKIPFIGWLFGIVGYVCGLYCTAGVVFTFLNYFKVGPFA